MAATTATLALAGRITGCIFHRARWLSGTAGRLMRSGMSRVAGLPATLALAAPGLLAVLAPCRRRPVKLRLCAAFGVFHVVFPPRRASPEVCSRRSFDFCVAARISAPAEIAKFFFGRGFGDGFSSSAQPRIFSKRVFAIRPLLVISAAQQPSPASAATAGE